MIYNVTCLIFIWSIFSLIANFGHLAVDLFLVAFLTVSIICNMKIHFTKVLFIYFILSFLFFLQGRTNLLTFESFKVASLIGMVGLLPRLVALH